MNYEEAKDNFLARRRGFKKALEDRERRLSSLNTQEDQLSKFTKRLDAAKVKLLTSVGTSGEKDALVEFASARDLVEAAQSIVDTIDEVPHLLQSQHDGLMLTSNEFARFMVKREMEAFPPESVEILKRAFSVYAFCGDSLRWKEFLAEVLSPERRGFTMVEIRELTNRVKADHGLVV